MTEDAAIRIDYDSAEFVHVTHTMEFLLHPAPPVLVPQDPWNSHRKSGLGHLQRNPTTALPPYGLTDTLSWVSLWLGVLCYHRQPPATLWQLVPLGLPGKHYGSRDYHHLPGQGSVRA